MADWSFVPEKRSSWSKDTRPLPKDWKKRVARQKRREPTCQYIDRGVRCSNPTDEVDHIIPRFEGGSDDPDNLMSLCVGHHARKTASEGHRAWASHKEAVLKKFDLSEGHPLDL